MTQSAQMSEAIEKTMEKPEDKPLEIYETEYREQKPEEKGELQIPMNSSVIIYSEEDAISSQNGSAKEENAWNSDTIDDYSEVDLTIQAYFDKPIDDHAKNLSKFLEKKRRSKKKNQVSHPQIE